MEHSGERERARERSLGTRGEGQASYVVVVVLVGLAGVAGFRSLGGAMETAIGTDDDGGRGVRVTAQAAEGDPVTVEPTNPDGVPLELSLEELEDLLNPGDGPDGTSDNRVSVTDQGATDGAGDAGCGMNPFCHVGNAWSAGAHWVSERIGDIPVLGPLARGLGGAVDGLWDMLWDTGKGLLTAAWRVGWDFIVEDVLGDVGRYLGKIVTLPVNAVFGTEYFQDVSWIPFKETGLSIGRFVKGIPNARHALGDVIHNLSLCVNPWNGQAAEDRGHACGATVGAVVDAVLGAKGLGKAAAAVRSSVAARRAATAAGPVLDDAARLSDDAARATDDLGRCEGGVCRPGSGACFTAGTLVRRGAEALPIEAVVVGSRVTTLASTVPASEVTAGWRLYQFEMGDPTHPGAVIEVETLRPEGTYDESVVGTTATVNLSFEEWGITGPAHLVQVSPAPTVAPGEGFVVLSTFRRQSDDVFVLGFEGSDARLEPTGGHRFWSLDRGDWVATRGLRSGERLRTQEGVVTVASLERKPGTHAVYNIEVEHEHTYLVGALQLLTHNNCENTVTSSGNSGTVRSATGTEYKFHYADGKNAGEMILDGTRSLEGARKTALDLLGDGDVATRRVHVGRLHDQHGRVTGFTIKGANGTKRIRIDFDERGPHYNVEIGKKGSGGQHYRIDFDGTQADVNRLIDQLTRDTALRGMELVDGP